MPAAEVPATSCGRASGWVPGPCCDWPRQSSKAAALRPAANSNGRAGERLGLGAGGRDEGAEERDEESGRKPSPEEPEERDEPEER